MTLPGLLILRVPHPTAASARLGYRDLDRASFRIGSAMKTCREPARWHGRGDERMAPTPALLDPTASIATASLGRVSCARVDRAMVALWPSGGPVVCCKLCHAWRRTV